MHPLQRSQHSTCYRPAGARLTPRSVQRQNITFGRDVSDARLAAVIRACALAPDLALMPGGLETEVHGDDLKNYKHGALSPLASLATIFSRCLGSTFHPIFITPLLQVGEDGVTLSGGQRQRIAPSSPFQPLNTVRGLGYRLTNGFSNERPRGRVQGLKLGAQASHSPAPPAGAAAWCCWTTRSLRWTPRSAPTSGRSA